MASKRILIMPGSQRRHSYNRRLAENVGELLKPDFDVDFLDPRLVEIPLFNQDLETDDDALRPVKALYRRFCLADGFVVLTPEYNGSFTPYLKNTVDWVSRLPHIPGAAECSNPFFGKPLLLGCATSGWSGGMLGLQSTRNLFAYLGCWVGPEQLSIVHAVDAWREDGGLIDEDYRQYMASVLKRFGARVEGIQAPST
ncbi:NADPH-dependent FMN reductase [Methylogaea oryzae]|uniref:NAD(P)H-dependent oxidoreductase n=1 Tax=Methylogaea oryzae TaxID=1295382 RepID=A0A8D5AJZ5_9GAMM|nr:NAD(P)H-dependent oxidoreductase [Methylogaea oryzae]BBL70576.1 NAD(P)H-dependent oxidoreductase [Methylogaea oryzae]